MNTAQKSTNQLSPLKEQIKHLTQLNDECSKLHKECSKALENCYDNNPTRKATAERIIRECSKIPLRTELELEIKNLREQLATVMEAKNTIEKNLLLPRRKDDEINQIKLLNDTLSDKQKTIDNLHTQISTTKIDYDREIISYKNEIDQLKKKIENEKQEHLTISQKQTNQIDLLNKNLSDNKILISNLNKQISKIETDYENTQQQLKLADQNTQMAMQKSSKIKKLLDNGQTKTEPLTAQLKTLKTNTILCTSGVWLLGIFMYFLFFNR
jgi:chromosome segregation ATPase